MAAERKNSVFVTNLVAKIIFALLIIAFLFLAIYGLAYTSTIDPLLYSDEHILFQSDSFILNTLVFIILILISVIVVLKFGKKISTRTVKTSKFILCAWVFIASIVWNISVLSVPGADQRIVFQAANLAAKNDFSFFRDEFQYFQMFPFQLGMVAIYEPFIRIFGGFAHPVLLALNAASLASAELALVMIVERLFHDPRITLLTAVLLGLCFQAILFTTFLYGNLLGFAAMLWACYFVIRFIENRKPLSIVWITLLCTFSIVAKSNSWIGVVAIVIVLLIDLIEKFHWSNIGTIILIIVIPMMALHGVQASYEHRADISLGTGTPQTAWFVMGFSESKRAPGWYNGYTYKILKEANWDTDTAKQLISKDFSSRLSVFAEDPNYAGNFFLKKFVSQWNEPTFESIWVSKIRDHGVKLRSFAISMYDGRLGNALTSYDEHYVTLIYFTFAAGLLAMFFKKRSNAACNMNIASPDSMQACSLKSMMLLPLFVLGGCLYHFLFEAKSQYALLYFVMMLPFSALGLVRMADRIAILTKKEAQ